MQEHHHCALDVIGGPGWVSAEVAHPVEPVEMQPGGVD